MTGVLRGVDLFSGAGGFTTGVRRALKLLDIKIKVTAINHWDKAVATHELNHPQDEHLCTGCEEVQPERVMGPDAKLFLLVAGPECFPAGTLILAQRGLVPIEEVQAGDAVLTHRGRWRAVVSCSETVGDTVVLKGQGHYGLEVSANHPIWTRSCSRSWKGAMNSTGYRVWGEPEWVGADATKSRYWATPVCIPESERPPCPLGELSTMGWWLVGRYLADGYLDRRARRGGVVSLSCGDKKKALFETMLTGWDVKWACRWAGTAWLFECRAPALVEWLYEEFGKLAEFKKIPTWLLGAEEWIQRAVLEGYLAGDGFKGDARTDATTVSKSLAIGLRLLSETLGNRVCMADKPAQTYTIEGREVEGMRQYHVHWHTRKLRTQAFDMGDGFVWSKIKKVSQGQKGVPLYNLSVLEDESYVADGIVAHNCVHFSQSRGARPRDDQSRSNAWRVPEWMEAEEPEVVLVENVREFEGWGPMRQMRDKASGVLKWETFVWKQDKHSNKPKKKCTTTLSQPAVKRRRGEGDEDYWKRLEAIGWQPAMEPDPAHKGETFLQWVDRCRKAGPGYHVEWKVICAADCGEPTIRRRFFAQMHRKDTGRVPVWPNPTHAKPDKEGLLPEGMPAWPTARDRVIDWTNLGTSIYRRKKPLAPKTMRRIMLGFQKYGLKPFILPQHQGNKSPNLRSVDQPLSTVTAKHTGEALLYPILINTAHGKEDVRAHSIDEPLKTIAGNRGDLAMATPALIKLRGTSDAGSVDEPMPALTAGGTHLGVAQYVMEPFLLPKEGVFRGNQARSVDGPLSTIIGDGCGHLVQPFLVEVAHGNSERENNPDQRRSKSVDQPLGSVTAGGIQLGIANAYLVPHFGERPGQTPRTHSVDEPLPTVTASKGAPSLCMPMVIAIDHRGSGDNGASPVTAPLSTQTTKQRHALAIPWLYTYYSSGSPGAPIDAPLPTARCKDGIGLCYPVVELQGRHYLVDIYFRMLTEKELALGQGFSPDYQFVGNKTEIVRQIGNAVPPGMACALTLAAVSQNPNVAEYMREPVAA